MKVKFTHMGTVLVCTDPMDLLTGYYVHDYLVEDIATGRVEKIRDDDYLVDGIYDVDEDFFDKYAPQQELEENEW